MRRMVLAAGMAVAVSVGLGGNVDAAKGALNGGIILVALMVSRITSGQAQD